MQVVTILFKVLLHELEKLKLLRVLEEVPIYICILEDLSASHNFVNSLLKEFKLFKRVLLYIMKQIYLRFNYGSEISCMLFCLVMIIKSLKVEHIFIQFIFSILNSLFFLIDFRVSRLLKIFIFVALVIAACFLSMFLPVSKAKPTKLMRAEPASHVIATLILLNRFSALRALLSVSHYPGNILALIWVFSLPLHCSITTAWSMGFLTAFKAKRVSTLTLYVTDTVILILNAIVTTWVRTPSHILIIICVWFTEPFIICAQIITFQIFQEHWVRNCHVTHVLWTSCLHALLKAIIYSLDKPIFPIFRAKLMTTT